MVGQGLISEPVKSSRLDIGFELPIPGRGVEHHVPAAELGQLCLGKGSDLALEFLDVGHALTIASEQWFG